MTANPKPVLPNSSQPFVTPNLRITPIWQKFLTFLVSAAGPLDSDIILVDSPHEYTASEDGTLLIEGGTVTLIELRRARITITLPGTSGLYPMSQGDVIIITFSVAPDLTFLPA